MGIFLSLSRVQLLEALLRDKFAERVVHVLFREEDVNASERSVVRRHAVVLQARDGVHAFFWHILLGEHHSEFLSAVVAVVEEDHHVAFLNTSIAVGIDERLHKFVGVLVVFRIGVITALNAFHHVGHLASLALNELVVSHFNAVPTLIAVHSIETADDAGNMCACRFAMLYEVGDESLAALRVGVTTVHEAVNISLVGDAVFACDVNEFEEVVERRVHTTR